MFGPKRPSERSKLSRLLCVHVTSVCISSGAALVVAVRLMASDVVTPGYVERRETHCGVVRSPRLLSLIPSFWIRFLFYVFFAASRGRVYLLKKEKKIPNRAWETPLDVLSEVSLFCRPAERSRK